MIFDDEVTLRVVTLPEVRFPVPAYVGNATATRVEAGIWDVGIGAVFNQNYIRVMVPLPFYNPATGETYTFTETQVDGVEYRGKLWALDGPGVVSRVHGEDHHVTYKLSTI